MRALFTAREALRQTTELLEYLQQQQYSFAQECHDSMICTSCNHRALAREKVKSTLVLASVAQSELQAEINERMPYVRRVKDKKRRETIGEKTVRRMKR